MQTLSRTAEKCRKCPKVKNCNNKRMEACALAELPKQDAANLTTPLTGRVALPMAKPYTPITIHMGRQYGDIDTSLEAIKEQISNAFRINVIDMVNRP